MENKILCKRLGHSQPQKRSPKRIITFKQRMILIPSGKYGGANIFLVERQAQIHREQKQPGNEHGRKEEPAFSFIV
jgi:hypothetical protein